MINFHIPLIGLIDDSIPCLGCMKNYQSICTLKYLDTVHVIVYWNAYIIKSGLTANNFMKRLNSMLFNS